MTHAELHRGIKALLFALGAFSLAVLCCGLWIIWPRPVDAVRESPGTELPATGSGQSEGGESAERSGEDGGAADAEADAGALPAPGGGWVSAVDYELAEPLEESAATVLEAYEAQGECALVQAGYLDLLGDTWSCVVSGDGWCELVFVSRAGEELGEEQSHVRVVRLAQVEEGVDRG